MTNLTPHQRSILEAVLLGLEIEMYGQPGKATDDWSVINHPDKGLFALTQCPEDLRIKPGQESKVIQLYADIFQGMEFGFTATKQNPTHYINIGPNGIVGGKL